MSAASPPGKGAAEQEAGAEPLLRVVKGDPSPEELAALVTVVAALASGNSESVKPQPTSEWAAHHRKVRGTHRHGAGAWRASAR